MNHEYRTIAATVLVLSIANAATACAEQQKSDLPPVEATTPSEDPLILNAPNAMSDGSPVPVHVIETIKTDIAMESTGAIGGVAVDKNGNIYNTNFAKNVWRTAPDGSTILLSDAFTAASGNFALENGDILQSDWREHKIYRIAPDGSRTVFAEGGLEGPVGIAQDLDGSFLVANHLGKSIARVSQDGGAAEIVLADPSLEGPNGVTVDPEGNVYIADLEHGKVLKWTPAGALLVLVELPGKGNAHNVYANGALYVNKIWDHVIYRVELDTGAFGIVAGNGKPGFEDGLTGTATIEEPNGIATNGARDTVYFNTHRGLMFKKPGIVIPRTLRLNADAE